MSRFDNRTISRRGILGGAIGTALLLACGDSSEESAVFKSLNGVEKGAVINVDNATWIGGPGYIAADAVMNDLAEYFKVNA